MQTVSLVLMPPKNQRTKEKIDNDFDFLRNHSEHKEVELFQKRCKYLTIKKQKLLIEISSFKETYQSKFWDILLEIDCASKRLQDSYQKIFNSLSTTEQEELRREFEKFEQTHQQFTDTLDDTFIQQKLMKEEEEELTYLYRKMAVLYHPDKHPHMSQEEEIKLKEKMSIIAILRKNNDLEGIKAFIEQEWLQIPPYKNKEKQDQSQKIMFLKQRIQRLEAEIQKLQWSEIYQTYQQSVVWWATFRLQEEQKLEKYKNDIEDNIVLMQELQDTTLAT